MKKCKVEGCENNQYINGHQYRSVCCKHYSRWKKYKSYDLPERPKRKYLIRICKIENCINKTQPESTICSSHRNLKYKYNSYINPNIPSSPEYAKVCKKHGQLKLEQTITYSKNNKNYLSCKKCKQITSKINNKIFCEKVKGDMNHSKKNYSYVIKRKFKITAEEYDNLLKSQNGVCKICKKEETTTKVKYDGIKLLSIDHCHISGKFRGLLCHRCNVALGLLKDSITNLESAIEYLKASI